MANVAYQGMDSVKADKTSKTTGKGKDRDTSLVTLAMPQGTRVNDVYVIVPKATLPSTSPFAEFLRVERWLKKSDLQKIDSANGKVAITAPAYVWTTRGLDLAKLAKPAKPKAERKAKNEDAPAATTEQLAS